MKTKIIGKILIYFLLISFPMSLFSQTKNPEDINDWKNKTILVFAAHPEIGRASCRERV